jgi:hypothetical protein
MVKGTAAQQQRTYRTDLAATISTRAKKIDMKGQKKTCKRTEMHLRKDSKIQMNHIVLHEKKTPQDTL